MEQICNHNEYTCTLMDNWGEETVYQYVCEGCGEVWYERVYSEDGE